MALMVRAQRAHKRLKRPESTKRKTEMTEEETDKRTQRRTIGHSCIHPAKDEYRVLKVSRTFPKRICAAKLLFPVGRKAGLSFIPVAYPSGRRKRGLRILSSAMFAEGDDGRRGIASLMDAHISTSSRFLAFYLLIHN